MGNWWNNTGDNSEELVPVPLCSPKIPLVLAGARARAVTTRGQRISEPWPEPTVPQTGWYGFETR
jgi:hypothetical protein